MTVHKRRRRQQRQKKPGRADPALGREGEVEIESVGRNGDGIAQLDGLRVFVPQALPGDRLHVRLIAKRADGYTTEVVERQKTTERAEPACPHFGRCGGCQLQHLPADDYRCWKVQQIETALASRGFANVDIRPLIESRPASRRRLRLAFPPAGGRRPVEDQPSAGGCQPLGFRARQSRDIVPIETCPIALPSLMDCLPPLNELLQRLDLASEGGELHLTATDTGIDLLIETPPSPNLADLEALGAFADQHDLARLAWRPSAASTPEPIAIRRPATVRMGGVPVDLPIGAFLQATEQAETAIRKAVMEAIDPADGIGDFFAGCGAFGLPLAAAGRKVIAIERDPAMVAAMLAAARSAGISHQLTADERDLDREPLDQTDLDNLDAIIIDPPRSGARRQVEAIAQTQGPSTLAMASCNPKTFARDARILADGGYRLSWVQPIDAFLWSAQIELVAAFETQSPS